jgi:thiamine biosynthesis protein ThiS
VGEEVRIVLNGRESEVEPGATVGRLVDSVTLDRSRVAVERNKEIVPRATWDATPVEEGDRIEVVTLVGGG